MLLVLTAMFFQVELVLKSVNFMKKLNVENINILLVFVLIIDKCF